ncbi:type I-F CRISPR-associated endoribonuclease Cas6/Csy4 [Modicisalibacter luteus]|uniref:Type I-F CRISPR-associated endoribonuclease Cas6/Csy4 n=1 Tax=Modicisalibacter luteus TaxID=453962 RepID=A0ABV7M0V5_9GAMM|nr:type I-F CRISPR-associated endoribonuclease Cas6/Csy4 [Halomonas lutea]GHA91650.1 type I-F CRISPR-associated endoribonuclease Cas6/Csy4 [Halomonas lutea]
MSIYYFSVHYLPANPDVRLLSGRCITALHYYLLNNEPYNVGVSFPSWTDETMGEEIAFVCEARKKLEEFRRCKYFAVMERERLFAVTDVNVVNEQQAAEARFVRNQEVKKAFPGEMRRRLVRAKKRAEERGEIFDPRKLAKPREFGFFHSSFLGSSSTGQSFLLHIQREIVVSSRRAEYGSKLFNSYGLATTQTYRGSVPVRLYS